MSSTSGSLKFKTAPGVAQQVGYATDLIGQEQQRLQSLQGVLSDPSQFYRALGLNPMGDPLINLMAGDFIAGRDVAASDPRYASLIGGGTAPTAPQAVADPGARPVEYRSVFTGKDWGKNDQAKQDQSIAAIKAWDQKNAQYQDYLRQKQSYDQQLAAYNGMQGDTSRFDVARKQAEILANQYKRATATQGQQQQLLARIQEVLNGTQASLDPYLKELETARGLFESAQGDTEYKKRSLADIEAYNQLASGDNEYKRQAAFDLDAYKRLASGDWGGPGTDILRQISENEQILINRMAQQLGSGWQTSSAGIEAMQKFGEGKAAVRDAVYQQDLNAALQRASGSQAAFETNVNAALQRALGSQGAYNTSLNNALGQVTGVDANLTNAMSRELQQLQSYLSDYLALGQGEDAAWQNLLGGQSGLLSLNSGLAGILRGLSTDPYSVSQQDLIRDYQVNAGVLGQNTQAYQPSNNSIWNALAGLGGQALGTGLGAFAGPIGAGIGGSLGGGLGSWLGGGSGGGNYFLGNLGMTTSGGQNLNRWNGLSWG